VKEALKETHFFPFFCASCHPRNLVQNARKRARVHKCMGSVILQFSSIKKVGAQNVSKETHTCSDISRRRIHVKIRKSKSESQNQKIGAAGARCMAAKAPTPAALAQVRLDAARVLARVQTTLSFQVATALQLALNALLAPGEQLAALVLLCVAVQAADAIGHLPVETVRGVLVVQVGQTLQGLLVFKDWAEGSTQRLAQGFLLNTLGLCVPSVLELLSPRFVASPYVQNALSVWLFQYASSTREVLARVDFGVSPAFVCLLAFALSVSAQRSSLGRQRSTSRPGGSWQGRDRMFAPPGACVWGPLSGPRGCDCGGRARSFGVGGRRFVQHGRIVADAGVPRCARTGAARL
jgi:hypothetical protein